MNKQTQEIPCISTGSPGLDEGIGGFPREEYTLVTGAEATGKSILCIQFLLEGLKKGERSVLITPESAEDSLELADSAGLALREYVDSNQLIILQQKTKVPNVLASKEDLEQMLDALEAEILPWEPSRMAIDSALPLIGMFHPDYRRSGLLKTLKGFGNMGLTTILTTRMPATSEAMSVKKYLEDNSGCTIHLDEQRRVDGDTQRRLVCRKAKHLQPPYPVFDFRIEPDLGVVIGKANRTPLNSPAEEVKMKQQPRRSKQSLFAAAAAPRKKPEQPSQESKNEPALAAGKNPEDGSKSQTHPPRSSFSFKAAPNKEKTPNN